ncbi:DUF2946 family protein [Dyella acidiphila]|uniref:DUF2946 family protein n=1 Tax=Dyella acidiphila TaxID=2775866 RepID=A0ABR9GDZ0_9GAMM|nr:DUF2946 family protein [Dyella acidiphila]MBE1162247.1 DUF2946 family protein [Dyella acidiphila]
MQHGIFQRQIAVAAWLALLLAICMPVIARVHMSSPSGDTTMAGMTMPQPDQHTPNSGDPLDACGYCSLFAHAPYVALLAVCMAMLPALPSPLTVKACSAPIPWRAESAFEPRGPPRR